MIFRVGKILAVMGAVLVVFAASAYLTLTFLIRSEKTVVVPDLIDKNTVDALKILSNLGLNTQVTGSEFNDTVPENHIVFQEPEAGTEIKSGRSVRIVISRGAARVMTPDLAGLSLQKAEIILEENDLCKGVESLCTSHTTVRDHVVAQNPPPGLQVKRGTCVDVLISAGRPETAYPMPALTGMKLNEATAVLARYDLTTGRIQAVRRKDVELETVIVQDPPAGHRVVAGAAVHLTVNKSPNDEPRTAVEKGLIRYRAPCGFLKKHIRIHMSGCGLEGDLFNGFVDPGEEIWVLAPDACDIELQVYIDHEPVSMEEAGSWRPAAGAGLFPGRISPFGGSPGF